MKWKISGFVFLLMILFENQGSTSIRAGGLSGVSLGPDETLITLLATNDIHGAIEATTQSRGGIVNWGAIVSAIRTGLTQKFADRAHVLVLDAGDQFQGTLISNYNEGQTIFAAMNEIGYDAVVPGNHAYDFGPIGWLDDQVTPKTADQNPRGALLRLVSQVDFPLVSANTFYKGQDQQPDFLVPYVIKSFGTLRVALIGLDNHSTAETTTAANVTDLEFRDEAQTYLKVRDSLEGKADIFVLIVHEGNAGKQTNLSQIVTKITQAGSHEHKHELDAVIGGHTHYLNELSISGVPIIQSEANGTKFGRIDLVWNEKTKNLVSEKTRFYAGVDISSGSCSANAGDFCAISPAGIPLYEGAPISANPKIWQMVDDARKAVAPLADRKLGHADLELKPDRISDTPLSDLLTDALRELSKADIAFINTGGIRTFLPAGNISYEDLFRVLPFNNHAVLVGPMTASKVTALVQRSISTCGSYGALVESGLVAAFSRACTATTTGTDPQAQVEHLETLAGQVLVDQKTGVTPDPHMSFMVATLDFLATGGAGYSDFKGIPETQDFGIFRELLTEKFLFKPGQWSGEPDSRWVWKNAPQVQSLSPVDNKNHSSL